MLLKFLLIYASLLFPSKIMCLNLRLNHNVPYQAYEYLKFKYQYNNVKEDSYYNKQLAASFVWATFLGAAVSNICWFSLKENYMSVSVFGSAVIASGSAIYCNLTAYMNMNKSIKYNITAKAEKMFDRKLFLTQYLSNDTIEKIDKLGFKPKDIESLIDLLSNQGYDCSQIRSTHAASKTKIINSLDLKPSDADILINILSNFGYDCSQIRHVDP